jgi:hypothetical protein
VHLCVGTFERTLTVSTLFDRHAAFPAVLKLRADGAGYSRTRLANLLQLPNTISYSPECSI